MAFPYDTKHTLAFAYGFMASFFVCIMLILLFDPYGQSSSSSPNWYFKDAFRISHFFPQSFPSDPQNTSSVLPSVNNTVIGVDPKAKTQIPESSSASTNSNGSEFYEHIESMLKCDLFDGKWVRDDSYPLYPHGTCPCIEEAFDCFHNRRPDNGYESYRWQPNHCNIPRLNGKYMLDLIRGKRLVFVGDSLDRNMWDSLMCVLESSVQDKSSILWVSDGLEFKNYNCSVEFLWSPFLVQLSETTTRDGSKKTTLRLDLMESSSDKYKDANILIFNSGHWWNDKKTSKGQNFYQEGGHVYAELNEDEAYRRGMTTWGRWVDANVNPMNTQVFFGGYSPAHFRDGEWHSGGRCEKETEPFKNEKHLLDYPVKMKMFESVMKGMKTPVHYLNITRLTDYRKDGHPAVYRELNLTEKEWMDPKRNQDCSHWCLPGVPDIWNEFLYAQLLIDHYNKHKQKTTT